MIELKRTGMAGRERGAPGDVASTSTRTSPAIAAQSEGLQLGQRTPDLIGRTSTGTFGWPISTAARFDWPISRGSSSAQLPGELVPALPAGNLGNARLFQANRAACPIVVAADCPEDDTVRRQVENYALGYRFRLDMYAAIIDTSGVFGRR